MNFFFSSSHDPHDATHMSTNERHRRESNAGRQERARARLQSMAATDRTGTPQPQLCKAERE